jgi:SAM-dependent methyltransferase
MSVAYRLLYGVGFTPWEHLANLPAVTERLAALLDREQDDLGPGEHRALDLGCGSGFWAVELAKRGWHVTGVDIVPKALRRARERARAAALEIRFVQGDVTNLGPAGIGSNFPFLLDFGLFHDELTDEQRAAMGREVTALATRGATLLMMAWGPRPRRSPLWRGATRNDIEAAYPGWTVIDDLAFDVWEAPFYRHVKHPDPHVYRLRRDD